MNSLFQPSISYWQPSGTGVREKGLQTPTSALNQTSLVLLIHGYNNDQQDASASYNRFVELVSKLGTPNVNLLGVYWPGANWEGPVYYMQAIGQAKKVAPHLADDLYFAAQARSYLHIDIITHSLGSRLTLEVIKALLAKKVVDPTLGGLVIGKVAFMAGAVPTEYLEDLNELSASLSSVQSSLSVYSEQDDVLKYAFPLGESLAGEAFFPVALGRKEWQVGESRNPPVQQQRNPQAGHSDYWGGNDKHLDRKWKAAQIVNAFLPVTSGAPRTVPSRETAIAQSCEKRSGPESRVTVSRAV